MANNRLPTHKREAAAAAGHANRYDNLPDVPTSDTIGPVSDWLVGENPLAASLWPWCVKEWWWLTEADRPLLELACIYRARLMLNETRPGDTGQYVTVLGKIGATPIDRAKVELPGDGDGKKSKVAARFVD